MRSLNTCSAERQGDIEIIVRDGTARVWLRTNHRQVTEEETVTAGETEETVQASHWECDEAYMECEEDEAPAVDEIEEDFDSWYEYAGEWEPARQKSLEQIQADVEYIAAMSGIELEV